jgi:UDP-glucose 4-epimerase
MIKHLQDSPVRPKRVVVLGSSGFVGKDLIDHLHLGGYPTTGIGSREIDLTKPESVDGLTRSIKGEDALVITSALTPDRGRDVATLMRNLKMGEHLAAFLERAPLAHVVYISSDAVYPDEMSQPVNESAPCGPSGFHGVMHLAREKMLLYATQKAKTPCLILRPSLLYGPGDTHNGYGPNRFLRTAGKDRKITLFGNGEEKRDHVFIKDVSRLTELSLLNRTEGVLNVATGGAVSFMEAAQVVASLYSKTEIECLPRANPISHRHFDITATLKAFPSFRYAAVTDGLGETFASTQTKAAA